MNERIKELADQATTYIEPTANSGKGWIFNKEKFAKLIVLECANIANTAEPFLSSDLIKQHFGFEKEEE
jgi:hypothetical protein